jgi:hypothetical protein
MEKDITTEKSKLVSEIQEVLSRWLNENPETRSVAFLSRKTGVADSTIRRLLNSGTKIHEDSIFKLLAYVFDVQSFDGISAALSEKTEALSWFQKHYAYMKTTPSLDVYKHSPIADDITDSVLSFSVYKYRSAAGPLTAKEIKDQFGVRGEVEIEGLILKGLVVLEGDILKVKDSRVKFTKSQAIELLPELTRNYLKKDHPFNVRILEVEGTTKEGYIRLMDLYERFIEDVSKTLQENPGNIPVIATGFIDSFTYQPYFEGGKNEKSN